MSLTPTDRVCLSLCVQRLSTATVPFTVISVAHNPCHEDFMVVCGLKASQDTPPHLQPSYSPPSPSLSPLLLTSLPFHASSPPLHCQECQLLVLNSSAQVTSRAVLHPSVDQDGYIVKVCLGNSVCRSRAITCSLRSSLRYRGHFSSIHSLWERQ